MDKIQIQNLKSLPIFTGISGEQFDSLVKDGTFVTIHSGQTLFEMESVANYIYVVVYGAIKLSKPNHEMNDSIINFMWRGDLLGLLVAENRNPKYPVNAIALEETKAFKVSRQTYLEKWVEDPSLRSRIQKQLMQRMLDMQKDKEMSTAPALVRVAEFLVRLISSQPEGYENRTCFKLTRTDMAARLNLTVETVIRTMSKLTKEKIIETKEHHVYILDMPKLKEYSTNSN